MGVTLCALLGHTLTAREVMQLPQFLSSCEKLKDFAKNFYCLNHPDDSFEWDLKWDYENSIELIEETWLEEKIDDNIVPTNFTTEIGLVYVKEHILIFSFRCKYWHWGNESEVRNRCFAFTEELAKKFNQQLVIFYPDSMVEQSRIENLAQTVEETLKIADQTFGKPTGIIENDISNYYLIQRLL